MKNTGLWIGGILVLVSIILIVYFVMLPGITPLTCGNGVCEPGETTQNCQQDCCNFPHCGDGICGYGETSQNCPQDCNIAEPTAGTVILVDVPEEGTCSQSVNIKAQVKNNGPERALFFVEAAIVPREENWLSVFGLSTVNGGQCCQGQENVLDKWIEIEPYQTSPVLDFQVKAPYDGIQDLCGSYNYYDGCGWWPLARLYTVYVLTANHCNYKEGIQQPGYNLLDIKTDTIGLYCP